MLETCCDLLDRAYQRNWITARDGNISVRNRDRDHLWITPSGVRKQTLQPDQWKKLTLEHNTDCYEYTDISSNLVPSGEWPMHLGLQKNIGDDDTRIVVHLHPTYCVAAMHRGIELNTLVESFPELGRYTSVAPNVPDVPPISQELANQVIANIGVDGDSIKHDIVGIKGHGVVAVDTTPWRAYEHIERLEHICKIVLASGSVL
jgi:ribulose-5-phosphate 4-epimerase/fuculose-1-phosphate aldolase